MARLTFRYTAPPLTQGATTLAQVGAAVALGSLPAAATGWQWLVQTVPEPALLIGGTLVGHLVLFWSAALACHVVDTRDWPAFIAKHRIQSGPPKRPTLRAALPNLLTNQLLLSPLLLAALWGALKLRGWAVSDTLPSLMELLLDLIGMSVLSVLWFYASHRFLHRPWWMKRVHRVHHEFRTTTALASEYAHWVEFIFGSFGTLSIGVLVLAPSLPAIWLFALVALTTVLVHHCGYAVPWASWAVHHDWHHFRYRECFGTIGVLDRLAGTDAELRRLKDGEVV